MKQIKSDDNGEASLRNIERQASIKEKSWWLEGIPQRPMVGGNGGVPAFPSAGVWKTPAVAWLTLPGRIIL